MAFSIPTSKRKPEGKSFAKIDPEQVHEIMDGCFKIMMDEIHLQEGTINQFRGDGVMALFGAPVAHEDHAQRACHAALSIQRILKRYSEKVDRDFGIAFKMRIGLNSGTVVVGAIGDDLRMDYTADGDTTNLASRIEHLARPGTSLISANTRRLVKDYFELKPLGKAQVKGKKEPQEIFELVGAGGAVTRIEAAAAKGLTRFVGRKNSMAALMEAYEKAKASNGQVVGMVGEAGVGKSRLLWEFRKQLPQGEFGYLEGRCIHFGSGMPYLPMLDILKSYFGITERENETATRKRVRKKIMDLDKKLPYILPPICELLSLKVQDETYLKLEPRVKREKLFEALRDLFVRGSQKRLLKMADEYTDASLSSIANWVISQAYCLKGDFGRAIEIAGLAVSKASNPFDRLLARNILAWAFCRAGEQEKHLDDIVQTVEEYRKAGAETIVATFGARLGECYFLNHQYNLAKQQFEITLKVSEKTGMKYYTAWCHHLLGEISLTTDPAQEKAPSAGTCFKNAISICRKIKAENNLAMAYAGLGRYYKLRGNVALARDYLIRALKIFLRLGTLLEPDKVKEELGRLPEG